MKLFQRALLCSALCLSPWLCGAQDLVSAKAPLLRAQLIVGSSRVSPQAALADAKARIAASIPAGRTLADQDEACSDLHPLPGGDGWECLYFVRTEAVPPPPKILWVVEPPRPHVLPSCMQWRIQRSAADGYALLQGDPTARVVDSALEVLAGNALLFWQAGTAPASQNSAQSFEARCFVITEGPQVLYSGAFVSSFSARLLNIPVLVMQPKAGPRGLVFHLEPRFPAVR